MANLAPAPQFPERTPNVYERGFASGIAGQRGPLRFSEGLGTDTDVPNDFQTGIMQGVVTPPGRPNHNANVYEKYPDETMRQRAHVGSAAWVEAPRALAEFAHGSFSDHGELRYEMEVRDGGHQARPNPAQVVD